MPDSHTKPNRSKAGRRRSSAISRALKCIREDLERPAPKWRFRDASGVRFGIFVARDRESLGRANELVRRMYAQRGYVSERPSAWERATTPNPAKTITLLAEDASGRAAGTVTLAFDGPDGLPSDEIYGPELDALRAKGRCLTEVTRLAIHDRHARSKGLLLQLLNFISIYARRFRQDTDFVVSVNPRHAAFYRRLLDFEPAGPERPCPRVRNAPAVLLRLDLVKADPKRHACQGRDRTLYRYSSPPEEEAVIVNLFRKALDHASDARRESALREARTALSVSPVSRGLSL